MNIRNYQKYALFFLVVLLTGCIAEEGPAEGSAASAGREIPVKVTLQMPAASPPGTYAISAIDENHVEDIDILAFKANADQTGWELAYRVKGTSITDQTENNPIKARKQFQVNLIADEVNPQQLVVLANVRSLIDGTNLTVGMEKNSLLNSLIFENAGSWNANNDKKEDAVDKTFTPFPMWGEVTTTVREGTTQITGVNLLRSIARMDVRLTDEVTDFKLDRIYVYNSKKKGRIVPDAANLDGATKVKAATLPTGDIENTSPLTYEIPVGMERLFKRTIYLLEAQGTTSDHASEATCLVVGGTYGSDTQTTYYRVDFFRKDAQNNYTTDYRDILRNHRYRIHITSVSASGYSTPQKAFESKALNMKTEITEWDDNDMTDVVFDGQYMLAVSPGEFTFGQNALTAAEAKNKMYVYTDYPTGWAIEKIVDATDETTTATWLSVQEESEGVAELKKTLWIKTDENTANSERTARIWFKAGRLRYAVTVTQGVTSTKLSIIAPLTGTELTELLFAAEKDVLPASRQFTVTWAPAASPVSVVTSLSGLNPAFMYYTTSDRVVPGTIQSDVGSKNYIIQPSAITSAELEDNLTSNRVTKVEFSITVGEETIVKSISLRQTVLQE